MSDKNGNLGWLKRVVIGGARNPTDRTIFHKLSLIAFFAWVGLGADGLSSSCYGPQESFVVLKNHMYLGLFVALAVAATVFIISYSYSQIVELFPSGGGGYLVASKLLSPTVGMISGSALLIDYVLTISISIASGADALFSFSFMPPSWLQYKFYLSLLAVAGMTIANLRGVRESVVPLVPIFLIFVLSHVFTILYSLFVHAPNLAVVAHEAGNGIASARSELGLAGMLILILRAYSMGAGTFTGIEAVSNGLPILREPRVRTAKKTMTYMALSLAFTAGGLMVVYCLHNIQNTADKTSNAVLLETMTSGWGTPGTVFVLVTLVSEAALLIVAAQAGFIDGPRVLSNMALDRWLPTRFALLSDRLVTAYGIGMMGLAAFIVMLATKGDVGLLVVLYSINVFITFVLSQLGMVRHWWSSRAQERGWMKKLMVNGLGLVLTGFILVSMVILKFDEGGWVTLLITGGLVALALSIKRHYRKTAAMIGRLDLLVKTAESEMARAAAAPPSTPPMAGDGNTAVLLVNGFNGMGLHSLLAVTQLFGKSFDNYRFVQVGVIDAGNFKGTQEVEDLQRHVAADVEKYVQYMRCNGIHAQSHWAVGVELVEEIARLGAEIRKECPNAVFFGGQLVFSRDTFVNRLLHNNIVFSVQRKLYLEGIPLVVLPIRV